MITVTMDDYHKIKKDFFNKHKNVIDEKRDGTYAETRFEDGAAWYEVTDEIHELVEVEVHKVKCNFWVSMLRYEFWSTDDSVSRYMYERR